MTGSQGCVFVIGSNSFSGSHFVRMLLKMTGYDVVGISRSPEKHPIFLPYHAHRSDRFSFFQYDLNAHTEEILRLMDDRKPAFIVNFAAQSEVGPSWHTPDDWFQTNVVALAKLVNALKGRTYIERYLHISTPEVYGVCTGEVTESAPLGPSTPYAASKAAADMFLFTMYKHHGFPLLMVRSNNVYGPGQQLWKIIPRSIINIKLGRKTALHGGGAAVKSYIHITDTSRGELLALLHGKPGSIYHLGVQNGVSVREVVRLVCEEIGVPLESAVMDTPERLGQDPAYRLNCNKARTELGWEPTIDLREGIREVIQWVDANWDVIRQQPFEYTHKR